MATYLAEPEGLRTGALPWNSPAIRTLSRSPVISPQPVRAGAQFVAQGAREGSAVAGDLLQAVNFPDFVSGLIKEVFHAIVRSSIEQMEAYGKLVADVAKTLNQFRDDNVTVNQGRDHVVDTFPYVFFIDVEVDDDGLEQPRNESSRRLRSRRCAAARQGSVPRGWDGVVDRRRHHRIRRRAGRVERSWPRVVNNCWRRWCSWGSTASS